MDAVSCTMVREHAAELALGVLSGIERAEVLWHVNGCARCQALVDEQAEVADLLPQLAPEVEPPGGFDRRVVAAIRGARRRALVRWAAVIAATAAAVAVASVAVVRVVDAGREPQHVEAAPRLRTVAMTGADGRQVGRVAVSGTERSSIAVNVDYAVPDGAYTLELRLPPAAPRPLGPVIVKDGHGEWSGRANLPADDEATITMVDASGAVVCEAVID